MNDEPARTVRDGVPPPSSSRSSRTAPPATATAPAETVVVVEAGVVVLHPADEPHGDVLVAQQLLVGPLVRVVADEVAPALGLRRPGGDEALELLGPEVATVGRQRRGHAAAASVDGAEQPRGVGRADRRVGGQAEADGPRPRRPSGGRCRSTSWSIPTTRPNAVDGDRTVGRRVVEGPAGRGRRPVGPPRAVTRSTCSGAPPARATNTTRRRGRADPPTPPRPGAPRAGRRGSR